MAQRPNIILIILDCVRPDHMSLYGYDRPTTPNLKGLDRDSRIYTQAISAGSWTSPAVASILTGKYPSQHGKFWGAKFQREVKTMPEMLREDGYYTYGITTQGVSSYYADDFDAYQFIRERRPESKIEAAYRMLFSDKGGKKLNRKVDNALSELPKPFFMFLHYNEAHAPYTPKVPWLYEFLPIWRAFPIAARYKRLIREKHGLIVNGDIELEQSEIENAKKLYDSGICYLDMLMGELFDMLKAHDAFSNTIIIITADHGEDLGEHNLFDHRFYLFDVLLRVPMIIHYPEKVKPGEVSMQTQTVDILPTILHLVGNGSRRYFPDISKRDLLNEEVYVHNRKLAFSEHKTPPIQIRSWQQKYQKSFSRFDTDLISVRGEGYKLIKSIKDSSYQFYDLESDPREESDTWADRSSMSHELANRLEDFIMENRGGHQKPEEIDRDLEQHLRDLGYID